MLVKGISPDQIEIGSIIRHVDNCGKVAIVKQFDTVDRREGPIGIIVKWVDYDPHTCSEYIFLRNENVKWMPPFGWDTWEITNLKLVEGGLK